MPRPRQKGEALPVRTRLEIKGRGKICEALFHANALGMMMESLRCGSSQTLRLPWRPARCTEVARAAAVKYHSLQRPRSQMSAGGSSPEDPLARVWRFERRESRCERASVHLFVVFFFAQCMSTAFLASVLRLQMAFF